MAGADLVPNEAIHELSAHISPELLRVLQQIQGANSVWNNPSTPRETIAVLRQLRDLGLVDAAYQSEGDKEPAMWVSNGNGARVLRYLTGIRAGPHYELSSIDLAAWLEEKGEDRWWNVDGDPLLTGRLSFPCPADELAAELRRINRPLLVRAKKEDSAATGAMIDSTKLDELVEKSALWSQWSDGRFNRKPWVDRLLYLCWKGSPRDWLLLEDSQTMTQVKAEQVPVAN